MATDRGVILDDAPTDHAESTPAPKTQASQQPRDLSSPFPSRVPPGVAAETVQAAPQQAKPRPSSQPTVDRGVILDSPGQQQPKGDLSRLILGEPIPQQEGLFTKAGERLSEGVTKVGRAFNPNSDVKNLWGIPGSGRVGSAVSGVAEILGAPMAPIGYVGSRGSAASVNDQALDARIARAEKLKREHPGAAGADPDVNALDYLKKQRAIPEAERIRQDQETARSLAENTVGMLTGVAGAANPGWLLRTPGNAVKALRGVGNAARSGPLAMNPSVANAAREVQASLGGQVARTGGHTIETIPVAARHGTDQALNEAERILTGGARGNQRTLEAAQELQTGRGPLGLGEAGKRMAAQRGTYQPEPLETAAKQIVRPTEEVLSPVERQFIERLSGAAKPAAETAAGPLRAVGKDTARGLLGEVKAAVAPQTLSRESADAAMLIRRTLGQQAQLRESNRGLLGAAEKVIDRMPAEARTDFVRRFESGAQQATPELDDVAKGLRSALDAKWKEVVSVVPKAAETNIEHYLPHYYDNPEKARAVFSRGAAVEGGKGFLKERQIPTYEVAEKLGLKMKDDNAVRITLQRLDDMDQMLTGHGLLKDLEKDGMLVHLAGEGKVAEVPVGYERLPGNFPIGGSVAVPKDVAQVFKNWLTPGLRAKMPKSYEAVRNAGAFTNMLQLGTSAFHATTTALNSVFSQGALGLRQVASAGVPLAERVRGVGNIVSSPLAPIRDIATGHEVVNAYRMGTGNPRIAKQVENIVQAGGRTSMQQIDLLSKNGSAVDNAMKALRRGEYGSAAAHGVPALAEVTSAPIMRQWVPKIKQGAFARLSEFEVRKLGPNATEKDIMRVIQKAWDSIDNRFGQIVYDNLFWNKTLRDSSFIGVRAVGWTYGTLRELGGGAVDAANLLRGGEFTNRTAYTAAMLSSTAVMGAVMNRLMTGENPKSLKDLYYPRTGGMDEKGNPQRVQLPTYIRDARGWLTHPWQTATGKLHPNIQMVQELATGTTFNPKTGKTEAIYDVHDPYYKIVEDVGKYIVHQLIPISFREAYQKEGATPRSTVLPKVGITPAPREVERSPEDQTDAENKTPYGRAVAARKKRERLDAGEDQ